MTVFRYVSGDVEKSADVTYRMNFQIEDGGWLRDGGVVSGKLVRKFEWTDICARPFVCASFATVRLHVKATVASGLRLHRVTTCDVWNFAHFTHQNL
jgi:hypothetical protein